MSDARAPRRNVPPAHALGPKLCLPDRCSFASRGEDIEAALDGGEGVPCYLTIDKKGGGVLGSRSSSVVCLRRCKQSSTRGKDVDPECHLGVVCSACDDGFIISAVDRFANASSTRCTLPLHARFPHHASHCFQRKED